MGLIAIAYWWFELINHFTNLLCSLGYGAFFTCFSGYCEILNIVGHVPVPLSLHLNYALKMVSNYRHRKKRMNVVLVYIYETRKTMLFRHRR